jgi:glutamate racemase
MRTTPRDNIAATPSRAAAIGVMDSGVGGLTVVRAILDQLPRESVHYLGDTAYGPYGDKTLAYVRERGLQILDGFADAGVKALVIACNTASAAMLRDARLRYNLPVIEVIAPAVRTAATVTRNGVVGVIGTTATISSQAYNDAFVSNPNIRLVTAACPRFVSFVEQGITSGPELLQAAHDYLDPLVAEGIDTLVLGCTHYPLLTAVIQYVVGDSIMLVSSAEETAKEVYRCLAAQDLLASDDHTPDHRFQASSEPERFATLATRFLSLPPIHVSLSAQSSGVVV